MLGVGAYQKKKVGRNQKKKKTLPAAPKAPTLKPNRDGSRTRNSSPSPRPDPSNLISPNRDISRGHNSSPTCRPDSGEKKIVIMDNKFLVVSFESQTKKIAVEEMAYDGIVDVIKERLGVTSPIMKYFDNDVNEYIDLEFDSSDFVKDYKVLKVKVSQRFSEREDTLNAAKNHDSQEAASSSQTRTIPGSLSPTRSGSPSRPSTPQSRPHTPVNTTPSPHSRLLTPLIRTVTPTGVSATFHKRSGKSWPKKYTFPVESIPRAVQQQFDLKQPLPKKEMRMFIDTLYLVITKYDGGLYTSSEMYEEIVDAILGAHPYLLKVDGLPLVSVKAYWKGKLVYKFGNSRKRHDGNLPEVVERKRKKDKEPERKEGGNL
ncbi:unnamed protein product [Mytilus coruscus]|uniref:PB1 domain-containing protein n=1 Tax=Mytilus coruscus TaxID=42192 RepID=A0A6J8D4G5_MYTCO|nr:unnamed protein product [Mytilus coruscus]